MISLELKVVFVYLMRYRMIGKVDHILYCDIVICELFFSL